MAYPRLTLIGMYTYNSDLFNTMVVPESVDKDLFVDNLLLSYGECPLIYTNYTFLKFAIDKWSHKWLDAFSRIAKALEDEYNPLHNFDRYEKYEDNEKTVGEFNTNGESETNTETSIENTISAFNEDDYQPDNKSDTEATGTSSTNTKSDSDEDRNFKHDGHLYGNIGVTTSQQMLLAEIDLRTNNNIYDIMAEVFRREMCLLFY